MSVRRLARERWGRRPQAIAFSEFRGPRYTLPTGITWDTTNGFLGTAVDTTYAEPSTVVTLTDQGSAAANAAALQAAIDAAAVASTGGTTIVVPAGSIYNGITLRARSGDGGWIYIVSSARSLLPLAQAGDVVGTVANRVTPADAVHMPQILNEVSAGFGVSVEAAAHHYRFVGFEATTDPAVACFNLCYINLDVGMDNPANFPHDIGFDRCYLHGQLNRLDMARAVYFNCDNGFVVGCRIDTVMHNDQDAQAILIGGVHGPFKICNNYLEATGENIMVGGTDSQVAGVTASDIEFRGNYCFKPLTWNPNDPSYDGIFRDVKNSFELKNGVRVLCEGNLGENCWVGSGQQYYMVLIKTTDQDGGATWVTTSDVTVCYNKFVNCFGGFSLAGAPETFPVGAPTHRVDIYDNVIVLGSPTLLNNGTLGQHTPLAITGMGPGTAFRHNTCVGDNQNSVFFTGSPQSQDVDLSDNIFRRKTIWGGTAGGVKGDGTLDGGAVNDGIAIVDAYSAAPRFVGNAFCDSAGGTTQQRASYTTAPNVNTLVDDPESAVYADVANGDYRLVLNTLRGTASDGSDPGANIDVIEAATAGVK